MTAKQVHRNISSSYPDEEQILRPLLDGVEDYAIYVLDLAGFVVTWNTSAARLKGYTTEEAIGLNFGQFFLPEDRLAGKPATLRQDVLIMSGHPLNQAHAAKLQEQAGFWIQKPFALPELAARVRFILDQVHTAQTP